MSKSRWQTLLWFCTALWPMLWAEAHHHVGRQTPPRANHRNFDCKKLRFRLIACLRIAAAAQVIDAKALILDSATKLDRWLEVSAGGPSRSPPCR